MYGISFSYAGGNDPGENTQVFVTKNGVLLGDVSHGTWHSSGGSGYVESTGGRDVYQRLEAYDTINLQTGSVTGEMAFIIFCVEFVNF